MTKNGSGPAGIGFFGILTIVFIVLKLCGVIDWSWWIVLAPFYVPPILLFIFLCWLIIHRK